MRDLDRHTGAPAGLGEDDIARTAELVKVLDSKMRLQILLLLDDGERVVRELVAELGKSQPLISQHLRVLRGAGLVTSTRNGREVLYSLAQPDVVRVIQDLAALTNYTEARDELAERRNARRRPEDYASNGGSTGAAFVGPPASVRPEIDPGLAPSTPQPRRD